MSGCRGGEIGNGEAGAEDGSASRGGEGEEGVIGDEEEEKEEEEEEEDEAAAEEEEEEEAVDEVNELSMELERSEAIDG